jgi:thiamine biosynthesis protein ThiS
MEIHVNGEPREVADSATVSALLERLGVPAAIAIVERNGAVVPKVRFDAEPLAPGDRVEIVRLMGGG